MHSHERLLIITVITIILSAKLGKVLQVVKVSPIFAAFITIQ